MDDRLEIVIRARAGDLAAFDSLVTTYRNLAYGYAHSVLGDFQLAQDAAQEAFLEVHRQLPRLREPAAFGGWLRRIVFKHCDRIRRRWWREIPLPDTFAAVAQAPGPADLARQREELDGVLTALKSLPPQAREALTLHGISGRSSVEIARYLQVPVSTVKKRIHDARALLKEMTMDPIGKLLRSHALPETFAGRLVRFPFPLRAPEIHITHGLLDRMEIRCRDAQSYFVPLEKGGRCDWTFYDRPGHRLTGVYEYRVVDSVKWGEGQLIRTWSRYTNPSGETPAEWREECFAVGRDAYRRVTVARDARGKTSLTRYLWPGEPHDEAKPVLMKLAVGASRRGYEPHEVTGTCRVRIGDCEWKCLKVVTAVRTSKGRIGNPGIYAEWYVAGNGRTILFRRFNGRGWRKATAPSSFESLRGAPEIRYRSHVYRHWYDCIPDIAFDGEH